MNQKNIVIFYIFLSFLMTLFLLFMNFFSNSESIIKNFDKLIFSLIFIIICIIGFSVSIKPRWYKKIIKKSNNKKNDNNKIRREGHHATCDSFRNHILIINNKKYCSGCIGLGIGALFSIILIIIYIFYNIRYDNFYNYIFICGLIFIYSSFFESILYKRNSKIHLLSNVFLIIGFNFIIISTLENSGDLIYGFICIIASFLFLNTRIQISILNHRNICYKCIGDCKIY